MKLGVYKKEDGTFGWKLYPKKEKSNHEKNLYFPIIQPLKDSKLTTNDISNNDTFLDLLKIPSFDGYFDQMSENFLSTLEKLINKNLPLKLGNEYNIEEYQCSFKLDDSDDKHNEINTRISEYNNTLPSNEGEQTKDPLSKFKFLRYASFEKEDSTNQEDNKNQKDSKICIFYSMELGLVLFLIKTKNNTSKST